MITLAIKKQITDAMKVKDAVRLATLKLLYSELHNEWIAKQHELSEEEELVVVRREVKKRKDAAESYEKVGRVDRAEAEKAELTILQEFLPAEMGDEELSQLVSDLINQLNATGPEDTGRVMGAVMQKVAGRAGGDRVARIVRSELT